MTECSQQSFEFERHFSKQLTARFNGGQQTSDAGGLLLREADRRLNLLSRFAACFVDGRDPNRIEHPVQEMVSQRVYGMALGYEDLNDHEYLRHDPLLAVMAGRSDTESALAGKSTLNRMELSGKKDDRYKKILCDTEAVDRLMVDVFLESYDKAPDQIVLDLDATDFAIHGRQEGRFFHGFYDHYCYLPLYIFCENQLLGARLRQANIDGSAGALEEVKRIAGQIRKSWPRVRIILRADSGFCRDGLMDWCENNAVDFVFGLARNSRLEAILAPQMREAAAEFKQTGQRARIFTEFQYETLAERYLQLAIQAVLDISNHIVADMKLNLPSEPRDLFPLLARHRVFSKGLSGKTGFDVRFPQLCSFMNTSKSTAIVYTRS